MKLIRSVALMQRISRKLKADNQTIGFVPTMGYLHEGHCALVRKSVKDCDVTVMSIYVNPLQFGPSEDFTKYPRDLKHDTALAKKNGVAYLFLPTDSEMYPVPYRTGVEVEGITRTMCGASRPGHFKGVATVVAKLFNIVMPDAAYFGQKDIQQATVITAMVRDLNIPLKIKVLPIVREPGGLAMSSRNAYLSSERREEARIIYRALTLARTLVRRGEYRSAVLIAEMKRLISTVKSVTIDYIVIVDSRDLLPKEKIEGTRIIAAAIFIDNVRLIDNIVIRR